MLEETTMRHRSEAASTRRWLRSATLAWMVCAMVAAPQTSGIEPQSQQVTAQQSYVVWIEALAVFSIDVYV